MREAETVLDASATRSLIPLFTDLDPGFDDERAYAVARAIHAHRLSRGEQPVGRKIGFTNRTLWPEYGVDGPIWNHVYDATVQAAGADDPLDLATLLQPRIEPEIQVHFARPPAVTDDEEAILACVDWIALGFEIVQSIYADWVFRAPDAIAGYSLHGRLIIGEPVSVAQIADCVTKLSQFTVELECDGQVVATGGGANVLGSPLLAIAYLTDALSRQPESPPLGAGEVVTTGTLTPLLPVAPAQTWTARATGIELLPVSLRTV